MPRPTPGAQEEAAQPAELRVADVWAALAWVDAGARQPARPAAQPSSGGQPEAAAAVAPAAEPAAAGLRRSQWPRQAPDLLGEYGPRGGTCGSGSEEEGSPPGAGPGSREEGSSPAWAPRGTEEGEGGGSSPSGDGSSEWEEEQEGGTAGEDAGPSAGGSDRGGKQQQQPLPQQQRRRPAVSRLLSTRRGRAAKKGAALAAEEAGRAGQPRGAAERCSFWGEGALCSSALREGAAVFVMWGSSVPAVLPGLQLCPAWPASTIPRLLRQVEAAEESLAKELPRLKATAVDPRSLAGVVLDKNK